MHRVILAIGLLSACSFPTPSQDYACHVTADCDSGRTCAAGYCVLGSANSIDAPAGVLPDAPASDAMPDADPFAMVAARCMTAGYTTQTPGLYRAVTTGTSWTAAEADCADDVAGATHLIVLSSQAEVTYLATQLGWIGLSDRVTEGTFVTVTGETGDVRPWASGQPDNGGGNEDCAQMKSGGQLDDDQCGNSHRYVCECDGKPATP